MTTLDFHSGVADKLAYACRLVRKAWRSGHQVVVVADGADLAKLDQLLWTFEPGEFLPHARLQPGNAPEGRLQRTPVWLVAQARDAPSHDVLVNLGAQAVTDADAFQRVIDVVADGAQDVAAGRTRWRAYKAAGHTPHNLAAGAPREA